MDLLGSHIGTRRDLAMAYFNTLVTASRDTSTSVSRCGAPAWYDFIEEPSRPASGRPACNRAPDGIPDVLTAQKVLCAFEVNSPGHAQVRRAAMRIHCEWHAARGPACCTLVEDSFNVLTSQKMISYARSHV